MNSFKYFLLLLIATSFSSCIKDEPLNPEADIEAFTFDQRYMVSQPFIDQANWKITLYLTDAAYKKGIAPSLTLSKGATSYPASGDSIHFDKPLQYVVTSESGENKKTYTIVPIHNISNYVFNFEKWGLNTSSQYEFPLEDDGSQLWSSGNPGAALAGLPKDTKAYPTHSTTDYYEGTTAAEMVTLKGTPLSELAGVHLIAGSIFYGNFNSQNAIADPLAATEFGQPFAGKALTFSGYYKYSPGADFQDASGTIVPGAVDSCSIYAIVYTGTERLNGKNILTSNRIIARATLKDGSAKANFTHFEIPFEYIPNADLSGDMMLAIVASASYKGGTYEGAVGSRLIIDGFKITR